MTLMLVQLPTQKKRQSLFPLQNIDIFVADLDLSRSPGIGVNAVSESLDYKDLLALNCLAKDLGSFVLDHSQSIFYHYSWGDLEFIGAYKLALLLMELYESHILKTVPSI